MLISFVYSTPRPDEKARAQRRRRVAERAEAAAERCHTNNNDENTHNGRFKDKRFQLKQA